MRHPGSEFDWWDDVDDAVLACLDGGRMMTTGEIAQKLGVSESAAGSFLAHMVLSDKVRILTVASVPRALRTQV